MGFQHEFFLNDVNCVGWICTVVTTTVFSSEATGEECIADEKQDPVPPTE